MTFDPEMFKAVLRKFASGVTIITSTDEEGRLHGATASAFSSLSLNPPLILVCLDLASNTKAMIDRTNYFCVNILKDMQRPHSDMFARKSMSEEDIAKVSHSMSEHGLPILDDALAFIECKLHARYPGGDHEIYVGDVLNGGVRQGRPLLYFEAKYRRLGAEM